jgi:two-component system, OmpR family, phosphate regulon sensor histidine kinase PhoR
MKRKTLTYIILLATISIAGTLLLQVFLLKNSYNYSEKQFRESVNVALKEVAWQILVANGNTQNFDSIVPVEMISDSYYLVNVDAIIDRELLKFHLIEEFKKHQLFTEFEFAIYNNSDEVLDQETFITANGEEKSSSYSFPESETKNINYFAIHFPDRSSYFYTNMTVWYLFTGLLLIVLFFFGYTLAVIIRQRQLSEIQKNFINNLTHELKTPISSIALSANVLNDKNILKTPERLFEYVKIILEQNNRLSANVEKVLNLASLEKNKLELNLEKIDLNNFLTELTEYFKKSDSGKNAKVTLKKDIQPLFILADKFHLTNLSLNILENSVKYCDAIPEIEIDITHFKKNCLVRITDNGIGIPLKYRKKIFKKFYRIPTGNIHNVKGFGLGLDYVKKIVNAHHWKIKVDDNPSGGSIFTLIIKFKK